MVLTTSEVNDFDRVENAKSYTTSWWRPFAPSFAALGAFCFGVAGAVIGMAQVWWLGPVGKRIGGAFGGDVGFELAFGFAFISYCGLRYIEKRKFGR